MLAQASHNFIEHFVARRGDLDPRVTLVDPVLADLDLADLEIATLSQDLVKHLGQNQRIDNVTAQDNRLGKHRAGT
jgi:hypothetical protein